jgi:PmbA protein
VTDPALADLARSIVERAAPGEQVEAFVARGARTSVKVYDGDVESFTSAESFGVGIRVIVAGRQGFAHAGSFADDVVADTLAEARDNAGFGEPDEWNGLAEPDGVEPVEHDLWNEAVVRFPNERKIDLALELESAVRGADPRITGVRTATFADGRGEAAVATSTGIALESAATSCHISVSAMADDGTSTAIAGAVDAGRDPELLDVAGTATDASSRALRLLGGAPVESQRLTIVLEPRLAASLVGIVGGTLSGDRLLKGRSLFAGRVGDQVASPLLTLVDDPTDGRSLGADSHDGEGLACRRNVLVDQGVLCGFLHDSYTGRRSGEGSTASAVRGARTTPAVGLQAPAVLPGSTSHDDLLASIDTGLLVESLSGLHSGVNPVSGDFSVGAEGVMIRAGEPAEPVREVTLASTIQRLLLDVVAVGDDLEWLPGGTGVPTIAIANVSLSGR